MAAVLLNEMLSCEWMRETGKKEFLDRLQVERVSGHAWYGDTISLQITETVHGVHLN